MDKQNKNYTFKIIIKIIAIVFTSIMTYSAVLLTFETLYDVNWEKDETKKFHWLERSYAENDIYDMYDDLLLYDKFDENYSLYWEYVNSYIDYHTFLQWYNTDDSFEDYEKCVNTYHNKVLENAKNCKYKENKVVLESYANHLISLEEKEN